MMLAEQPKVIEGEWPLFGVEPIQTSTNRPWVRLLSLQPITSPEGLRKLLEEIIRLERYLEEHGIVGWVQAIKKDNVRMQRCTELIGAELYKETDTHYHYRKVADSASLPQTVREAVSKRGHHGTA